MTQSLSRFYHWFLAVPLGYQLLQNLLGARRARRIWVKEHVKPQKGDRILDIGCGTAAILEFLPAVDYYGFDMSAFYIEFARKKYGDRGHFEQKSVNQASVKDLPPCDFVFTTGVIHHLSDDEAEELIQLAFDVLKPGGRFVTSDPARCENRPFIENFQINRDRGQFIRKPEEYCLLAKKVFDSVTLTVYHNLLYIPYSHAVLEAKKP